MRPMKSLPAAAGLLLVLSTGAFSAPIYSGPSEGHGGHLTLPGAYFPWAPGRVLHFKHRSHGFDLRAWQYDNEHRHGAPNLAYGFGRLDEGYPVDSRLCGGHPGAGISQDPVEVPAPEATDWDGTPGEDGSDTQIASTVDPKSDPIPAVPEPGSLAMLGAGGLGLLAARGLLKRK